MNTRSKGAIFTPWAQLLCFECHENAGETHKQNGWKSLPRESFDVGGDSPMFDAFCCGCLEAVKTYRADVAACSQFVNAYGDRGIFALDQTGGMCVAARYFDGKTEILLTEDEDIRSEGSEPVTLMGGVYEYPGERSEPELYGEPEGDPEEISYAAAMNTEDAVKWAREQVAGLRPSG